MFQITDRLVEKHRLPTHQYFLVDPVDWHANSERLFSEKNKLLGTDKTLWLYEYLCEAGGIG